MAESDTSESDTYEELTSIVPDSETITGVFEQSGRGALISTETALYRTTLVGESGKVLRIPAAELDAITVTDQYDREPPSYGTAIVLGGLGIISMIAAYLLVVLMEDAVGAVNRLGVKPRGFPFLRRDLQTRTRSESCP